VKEEVRIEGLRGLWRELEVKYDYNADSTRCPNCGGVGFPWAGWFTCDTTCKLVAVVADGRAFLPIAGT
jgi:hypothetical protein